MNRNDLTVGMPVFVLVYQHSTREHRAYKGIVAKIARKYVTCDYVHDSGLAGSIEFDIETQRQRGVDYGYAARFRTVEQHELEAREKRVRDGLRKFGLLPKYTGPTTEFTLTLDDMAAVLALLEERYQDAKP